MNEFKLPPQAVELEQSIIAAFLLNSEAAPEIIDTVKPADFYRRSHQKIMETAREIHSQGEPIDAALLAETFHSKGLLESIGGGAYISELLATPIPSNIETYCQRIKQKAALRRLIDICSRVMQNCYQADDPEGTIEAAQQQVLAVQSDHLEKAASLDELLPSALERYESLQKNRGQNTGIASGFPDLDEMLSGFQGSDLIILAARPSMGKTALATSLCLKMGLSGVACGIFSLEMSRRQILDRMTAITARVNSAKFRNGRFVQDDWAAITGAFSQLSGVPIWIDDVSDSKFSGLRKRARQLVRQGVKIIFIDYLQLITGSSQINRNLEISEITRGLKLLAKDLQIPIVLLSQLSRKCEERDDKRPRLSDLRDSGSIEQDADVVLFLYRDEVYKENHENKGLAELKIAKHRSGPIGTIGLSWNAATTGFYSMAGSE